jgi:transcriptional regulatory protein RtcR
VDFRDPWDFEEVYGVLLDFSLGYAFDVENEEYLLHITTGTHVAQICLFLLAESRRIPAKLLQTGPPPRSKNISDPGTLRIIDLDLSRYDRIAQRFQREQREGMSTLKAGIDTRNREFNRLIERMEQVAIHSTAPILLTGPTGAGKSQMARRIFDLKKSRRQVAGDFVEVNCATLRGDGAMSALFGHKKGAFTGAMQDRPGLLRAADGGLLFLDEIGELGGDEQAMLLRAVEDKRFLPVGSDQDAISSFQLIAGTNRDLAVCVRDGRFREDLLARINLWTFRMPGLVDRLEDLEPNLEYELEQFAVRSGVRATMSREAREEFLHFATSKSSAWKGNFRDLGAAVARMATLAHSGRITLDAVREEIERLRLAWAEPASIVAGGGEESLRRLLGDEKISKIDPLDRVQLAEAVRVCQSSRSLADAGRKLFSVSRQKKENPNDADRIRKYLARFGLSWQDLRS